jgi:hypothetical protein
MRLDFSNFEAEPPASRSEPLVGEQSRVGSFTGCCFEEEILDPRHPAAHPDADRDTSEDELEEHARCRLEREKEFDDTPRLALGHPGERPQQIVERAVIPTQERPDAIGEEMGQVTSSA